jgi:hypothetical protein
MWVIKCKVEKAEKGRAGVGLNFVLRNTQFYLTALLVPRFAAAISLS